MDNKHYKNQVISSSRFIKDFNNFFYTDHIYIPLNHPALGIKSKRDTEWKLVLNYGSSFGSDSCIIFDQILSDGFGFYITLDELVKLSKKIKQILQKSFECILDDPILFISTSKF